LLAATPVTHGYLLAGAISPEAIAGIALGPDMTFYL
jgi:hypothetical protein